MSFDVIGANFGFRGSANEARDVFEQLKQGTADLHRRVDTAVDLDVTCADVASYRGLLSRLLGYYEPVESTLSTFDWQSIGLDYGPRRKLHLLVEDLHELGLDAGEIDSLPRFAVSPTPLCLAGAIGVMYVLEGATLGGQIIVKRVAKTLGLSASGGARFHAGYGTENGAMWRAFKTVGSTHLKTDDQKDAALHFARRTFETYEAWLTSRAELAAQS